MHTLRPKSSREHNRIQYSARLDGVLGILQKVDLSKGVLCISSIELDNLLDLVERQEINDERLLADDPVDFLGTRWGSEGALVTIFHSN